MTTTKLKPLWVEKYRPTDVADYVFQNAVHRASIEQMIENKSIPQLIFSGKHGTGKTTLAQILISEMELDPADILTINASTERGIDTFRDKIQNFALAMAMGDYKIIHLEEADKLTPDAQDALKSFMEEVSDSVRFIFTCNHVNKIIPPIRSRCQEFQFKAGDIDDVTEFAANVLASENVKFSLENLDKFIAAGNRDVRKTIQLLEQYTIKGVLQPPSDASSGGDYQFELLDLLAADKWVDARKLVCASITNDDWEAVFRFLYENIHKAPKFKNADAWESAILIIADHLYKHTLVADPEINAAAMFIALKNV